MEADKYLDWVRQWAQQRPEQKAYIDVKTSQVWTYQEVDQAVDRLAHHLMNLGLERGERVALLSPNKIEVVLLFLACQRLDLCLVPLNFRLAAPEIEAILEHTQASLLYKDESLSFNLNSLTPIRCMSEVEGWVKDSEQKQALDFRGHMESVSLMLYTSGTTGFPKGVPITNAMLFWNSLNTTMSLDLSSEDVSVSFLPLFHTGGWNVLLTPFLHRGACTVFLEKFDAAQVLKCIETHQVTVLFGVPTTLTLMLQEESFAQTSMQSLRFAVVGGEPMSLQAIRQWHERGVAIRQGYGMTECGPNCFSLHHSLAESKSGSIGRLNFYLSSRIVNDAGEDVEVGEVGELWLKGPVLTSGYFNNPEANAESFVAGWFRTGDLLRCDHEGDHFVVGRKKDMYISGGENVYPAEVEKVLTSHPNILEAAVIGVKDDKWGEVGRAFVVSQPQKPIKADEIREFCLKNLAKFKVPKHIEFIESLPKSDANKILKRELKDLQ